MLTTTVRRDATSRFAKNVRWGTFPSVALGWRVTEESFLKDNKVISTLKVRASYGVTGRQDGIGNYNYLYDQSKWCRLSYRWHSDSYLPPQSVCTQPEMGNNHFMECGF